MLSYPRMLPPGTASARPAPVTAARPQRDFRRSGVVAPAGAAVPGSDICWHSAVTAAFEVPAQFSRL
jgi:hypothetical protein